MSELETGRIESPAGADALETFLKTKCLRLRDALELFSDGGGAETLAPGFVVEPFFRWNGYSGYRYVQKGGAVSGEVGFAPQNYGGFVLHKIYHNSRTGVRREWWDIYFDEGILIRSEEHNAPALLYVDQIEMDLECPIRSHLYNYLAHEYDRATQGGAYTKQIVLIEEFIRTKSITLHLDPAVRQFWKRINEAEAVSVLSWDERQKVIEAIRAERSRLLSVKARAHKKSRLLSWALLLGGDWVNRLQRVRRFPRSILAGFAYKYTIGIVIWFVETVKGNIGYSMALALYGPFTFYFITQPLNPHAMWAVGKVRGYYLESVEKAKGLIGLGQVASGSKASSEPAPGPAKTTDQGAASVTDKPTVEQSGKTNAGLTLPGAGTAALKSIPGAGALGIPLSFEYPEVDRQSWSDRMSSFKDMQIAYESNMQFAARMGRLEQMETQLNFAMIMDVAWREVERYLDQLSELRKSVSEDPARGASGPTGAIVSYLEQERIRSEKIELYLWDRQLRYILDHPFTVMDQSKEQVYRDSYIGHAFLLLRQMTQTLAAKHGTKLKKPAEYAKIEKLAASFERERKSGSGVLDRLKANSAVFSNPDPYDGQQLRAYMKRQWEILYLLQNKAQEASNFGLQTYTWSVRNAIFTLQGIYSAKRRELELYTNSVHSLELRKKALAEVRLSIDPLYEQLFHLMTLEYASINPELGGRLAQDIESKQRRHVIETVEESIRQREEFLRAWGGV